LESVGMRQSDDDYCKPSAVGGNKEQYCKNDGVCYSTNDGPKCDCSLSDFDGRRCEQASSYDDHIFMVDFSVRLDAELSFFGNEWLGYDVSNNSAATIRSRFENISFAFKTIQGRQTLFFSGDQLVGFTLLSSLQSLSITSSHCVLPKCFHFVLCCITYYPFWDEMRKLDGWIAQNHNQIIVKFSFHQPNLMLLLAATQTAGIWIASGN
uniref:EGF-like domain-containing protein n=1 Tax=Anisakis simplex TaxID=6269 RepID=A0A0M3JE34_ANISI